MPAISSNVGTKFPDIEGKDLYSGKTIKVSKNIKNKIALINIWASWCQACRIEKEILIKIKQTEKLQIIGINYKDSVKNVKNFLKESANPYDNIICDPKGMIGVKIGIYGVPQTFIVDKQGIILNKYIGPIDEKIWNDEIIPLIEDKN